MNNTTGSGNNNDENITERFSEVDSIVQSVIFKFLNRAKIGKEK